MPISKAMCAKQCVSKLKHIRERIYDEHKFDRCDTLSRPASAIKRVCVLLGVQDAS